MRRVLKRPAVLPENSLKHGDHSIFGRIVVGGDIDHLSGTGRDPIQPAELRLQQLEEVRHRPRRRLIPPLHLVLRRVLIRVVHDRFDKRRVAIEVVPVAAPAVGLGPVHDAEPRVEQEDGVVAAAERQADHVRRHVLPRPALGLDPEAFADAEVCGFPSGGFPSGGFPNGTRSHRLPVRPAARGRAVGRMQPARRIVADVGHVAEQCDDLVGFPKTVLEFWRNGGPAPCWRLDDARRLHVQVGEEAVVVAEGADRRVARVADFAELWHFQGAVLKFWCRCIDDLGKIRQNVRVQLLPCMRR